MNYTGIDSPRDLGARDARQGGRTSAFTLIELLAITAVVALLLCVFVPALARTAPNSTAAQCQNNLRHLIGAWTLYADDNNGQLVYNHDGGNAGKAQGSECWAAGWLDFSPTSDNTNTDMLINHERYPYGAYFGPYLKSARPFKCPADKSRVLTGGQMLPRVRSVSMNLRIGVGGRLWTPPSAYLLYTNMNGISSPPSELFVLLDELPGSLNDPCFVVDPDTPGQLICFPASMHNGGAGFVFADGHTEVHRWKDSRTMPPYPYQTLPLNQNFPGNVDVQWIQEHAAARR
jgi:prepilin-type processing-associated H-X9-DG protein